MRRGPAGVRWRLGQELRWPRWERVSLNWSALAATSRLRGRLTVAGKPVRFAGWRASLEHVWGDILIDDEAWEYWSSFVVHGRGGAADIVFGLNRRDTARNPGARDAQWLGVLARVRGGRTRVCRPQVHRRGWEGLVFGYEMHARVLHARSPGGRLSFRTHGHDLAWGGAGPVHFEFARPATTNRGGVGVATVLGHEIG